MFRKKTNEKREIALQSFYNLEDRLTEKLGTNLVTVAFTASSDNTDKTLHILNMAKHLAEDGDRVLIIDANLRESHLPAATGKSKERGFVDIILGDYSIDDALIHDDSYDDLSYIFAGEVADYADKFLEPDAIKAFYNDVRDRYDYVFIDLSPNIDIPEANMFAGNADAAVVFSTYDKSNNPVTRDSLKQLEKANANILGIIITDYLYAEEELDELFGGEDE